MNAPNHWDWREIKPPKPVGVTLVHSMWRTQIAVVKAATATCRNGHLYTPENTLIRSDGHRKCKTCARAADKRQKGK